MLLISIANPNGGFASSDADKAELFKNHLAKTFTPHPDTQMSQHPDLCILFPVFLPAK